jgi:HD-GYP domain-containing protein (c-di-GMP phosphodiesterase class II)
MKRKSYFGSGDIICRLTEVARMFRDKPYDALKELHEISAIIDSQIPYREGHTERVSDYALQIGKKLGFSETKMVNLEAAALLHDFGKIGVEESIFLKPDSLSKAERMDVEMHVLRGYYILLDFAELVDALEGVKTHHEQYDGSGYPDGLSENEIPMAGRIIAVADVYAALTSERPYRKPLSKEEAIKELKKYSGKQFDPEIIEMFIQILDNN